MTSDRTICVAGCAASTPIGTTAKMSALMFKADVVRILSHPACQDGDGKPVVMGLASYLKESLIGNDRINALLEPTIEEIGQLSDNIKLEEIAMFIGTPEPRPGFDKNSLKEIKKEFNKFDIQLLPNGHASSIVAIEKAGEHLLNGTMFCLAGGVDSYCNPLTLAWLHANERLKLSGTRFGFIPGEAAGLLLLVKASNAKQQNLPILADILATAIEDENNTKKALSKAMTKVLEHLPDDNKVSQTFCDLNGEQQRSDEYAHAYMNNKKYFSANNDIAAPSDCWGDIGAATGANLVNLAIESCKKGSYALILTSSDSGKRSALLLKITGG